MVAEVAGEGAPAAGVREAAAEDAVGAGHVRGVAQDRADVGLGPVAGAESDDAHGHTRDREDLADEVARVELRLLGRRGRPSVPSAHRQSGFATIAMVIVSSGYGVGTENHSDLKRARMAGIRQPLERRLDSPVLDPRRERHHPQDRAPGQVGIGIEGEVEPQRTALIDQGEQEIGRAVVMRDMGAELRTSWRSRRPRACRRRLWVRSPACG